MTESKNWQHQYHQDAIPIQLCKLSDQPEIVFSGS